MGTNSLSPTVYATIPTWQYALGHIWALNINISIFYIQFQTKDLVTLQSPVILYNNSWEGM